MKSDEPNRSREPEDFRAMILRRGEEAERGVNVISHEEMKRRLAKWLDRKGDES